MGHEDQMFKMPGLFYGLVEPGLNLSVAGLRRGSKGRRRGITDPDKADIETQVGGPA